MDAAPELVAIPARRVRIEVTPCLFATDLHGSRDRYRKLFDAVRRERPRALFLGGDLTPHGALSGNFLDDVLAPGLEALRSDLGTDRPDVFSILGNDDPAVLEATALSMERRGLWTYIHGRRVEWESISVFGYAMVPPTPFLNKDWEKYDVSRYVPPGGVSPEEGFRTRDADDYEVRFGTIARDLEALAGDEDLSQAVALFHTPPAGTCLDRAATDGLRVEHVPLDLHVGSIAVRRFIERRGPLVTLHGHIHESVRLTGAWRERIGRTHCLGAAHDGPELCLVRFDARRPDDAERVLV